MRVSEAAKLVHRDGDKRQLLSNDSSLSPLVDRVTLQSPFAVEEGAYCFAALARKREENSLRHLRTRGGYGGGRVKETRTPRYTLGFAHFFWNALVKNSYACEICKASAAF